MKKYSNYFKRMMIYFLVSMILAIFITDPTGSAIMFVLAFVFWYAAIMAPSHEKYKDIDVQDAVDRWIEQQNEIERGK